MKNLSEENRSQEMRIVCVQCNKDMGEQDGEGVGGVSHGLCQECLDKLASEVEDEIMMGLVTTEDAKKIIANAKKVDVKIYDFRPNHFSIDTSKMDEQMIYNQAVDRYHRLDVILRSQILEDEDAAFLRGRKFELMLLIYAYSKTSSSTLRNNLKTDLLFSS